MTRWLVAQTDYGAVAVPLETVRSVAVFHRGGKEGREVSITTADGTKRTIREWIVVPVEALRPETDAQYHARAREIRKVSRRTGSSRGRPSAG